MISLYLLRHGKSSWNNAELADRARTLNPRGLKNAPLMGQRLADRKDLPEIIISSPAVRAEMTAKLVTEQIGDVPIIIHQDIYGAGVKKLIKIIHKFDDEYRRVMLVGHNPYLTILLNHLTDSNIANMPTCALAKIDFLAEKWISVDSGELDYFDYPKKA